MKEILKKYVDGNCSKEEFDQAVSILKGERGKSVLNDFMKHHWTFIDKRTETETEIEKNSRFDLTLDRIHHLINLKEVRASIFNRLFDTFSKIAAILVLPLVLTITYLCIQVVVTNNEALTTLTIPLGGIQGKVDLPDGSVVWLNSGSRLVYPSSFKGRESRRVELSGEGYFEVAKNSNLPFFVDLNDLSVKVLGTTFNVSSYNEDPIVYIALLEGSVQILKSDKKANGASVSLSPMQVSRYYRSTNQIEVTNEESLERYIAWKNGKMFFENEPFENVLLQMSRKYNVEYVIDDNEILDYCITGTFFNETFDEFMRIIKLTSPVNYKIIPGVVGNDGSIGKRKVYIKKRS